jgi:hypothetical protein
MIKNTMTKESTDKIDDLADIAAIMDMADDPTITYQYWSDKSRIASFLRTVDADVMATSRIVNMDGSQKRPMGSMRQKMPAEVVNCPKTCDQVKALSPAHLEAHGGIAQLVDIGWLKNGDPCILYLSETITYVGFLRDGCIVPYLQQTLKFKTPSDWIRHEIDEGLEVDKKNFEMLNQHLNLKTYCYRFLHFPVFNNATLHQLAGLYVHSSKCEGVMYPLNHKKGPKRPLMLTGASSSTAIVSRQTRSRAPPAASEAARKRDRSDDDDELPPDKEDACHDERKLGRDDVRGMFTSEVTLDLDSDGAIHREQQQQIMQLNIKLSAFHQFFMAIHPD